LCDTFAFSNEDLLALINILIVTLRILEVGHTAGVSYELYDKTITFYGNPNGLLTYPTLGAVIAISGVITSLSRCVDAQ